jgi:signal transduction histidine kinase/HAMP domain-containing protein
LAFLNDLTIGKKITLLTALGLLICVGLFSALGMRAVNQATDTMLEERLTTARLVAGYVDEALSRAIVELQNTVQVVGRAGTLDSYSLPVSGLQATYARSQIDVYGFYIYDGQGRLEWTGPDSPTVEGADMSNYPSVKAAMGGVGSSVSGLVSAPITNVPIVLLAASTGDRPDKRVMVVAIDVTRSGIGGFVRPVKIGTTGYVEIVDQNGLVVTRTDPGPKLSFLEKSDHSGRFATLIAAGEPARGVCHTCHQSEQRIARADVLAFAPLSIARWGVVIRQSEAEALAPASGLRQSLILSGGLLVTVALVFVIVTTRDVGTRITTLTTASRRIAEGDLKSPVARLGHDEVGVLANTLDDMRIKLDSSYGELEQKTRELSSLLSVSEILTTTSDLAGLLNAVLAKAVEVVPGADGGVLLLQRGNEPGLAVYGAGKPHKIVPPAEILAATAGISVRLDYGGVGGNGGGLQLWEASTADKADSKVKSHIVAEVSHQGRNIGYIIMANMSDHGAFTESDRKLLHGIADYTAIAIERAQLTKQAEEARAIYEADRLRSHFISSVSHELRSPLTLIKGYSTSLLRQEVSWTASEQREFLQVIDEKTDVLRDLIDKLLQSAKLEAGALRLEKEPVLIPQLARRLMQDMELKTKRHSFKLEFASSFPVVEADVRCMEQVLRNLLQNAVKYSPEGSEITVGGEAACGSLVVHVSDRGIGIPTEDLGRVFERFYRGDSPAVHSTPGSGLGLSITKGHVEAHGGKIWVESTPGRGSRFSFSLPVEIDDNRQY